MRVEPVNQLSKDALTVWRIYSSLTMVLMLLLSIGLIVISLLFSIPLWIGIMIFVMTIVLSIFFIVYYTKLQWERWKYEVHESEIDLQHGVLVVRRTLIPMVRIQHVDTQQGPLLRKFNLATVIVSTAATIHEIPGLNVVEADKLRDQISQLARVMDHDE